MWFVVLQWCVWMVLAFALALQLHREPVEMMAPAAFGIVLVIYLGGLMGNLMIGMAVVWLAAAGAGVYVVGRFAQPKQGVKQAADLRFLKKRWAFTLAAAALLSIWVMVMVWGRKAVVWDDLSHWSLALKNMIELDQHHCVALSSTKFRGYPPASGLFEYFFARFSGQAWEQAGFFAMDLLMLSCVLPAFRQAGLAKMARLLLLAIALFALPQVFYENAYVTLYVDALMGLLMAWMAFTALSCPQPGRTERMLVCLGGAVLALTKEIGMVLVILTLAVIVAVRAVSGGHVHGWGQWRRILILPAAVLVFAGVFYLSWGLYRSMNGTQTAWNVKLPWSDKELLPSTQRYDTPQDQEQYEAMAQITDQQEQEMRTQRVKYFFRLLLTSKRYYMLGGGIVLSFAGWGLCAKNKAAIPALIAVAAGFVLYALGLLYLYLYSSFEPTPTCPSQERYLFTYLMFALFTGGMLLTEELLLRPHSSRKELLACTGAMLYVLIMGTAIRREAMLWIVPPFSSWRTAQVLRDAQQRDDAQSTVSKVEMSPLKDRVGLLVGEQGPWGAQYDSMQLALVFAPVKTWATESGWSDPAQWTQRLKDTTYLYVYRMNPELEEQTREFFAYPAKDDTLYRVEWREGRPELTQVQ